MNVYSTECRSDCDVSYTDCTNYSPYGSYVTTVPNVTIGSSGVGNTASDSNLYSATISVQNYLLSSEYEKDKYELQNEIGELKKKLDTAMGLISELLNFKSQAEKGIEPTKLEGDDRVFESLFGE